MLISCPRENLVFLPFLLLDYRLYWHEWFQHRKSDNQHIIGTIYISYWHGSNLIESVTQTSRIIVVICFKRNDFKKSKVSSKDSSVKYFAMFFFQIMLFSFYNFFASKHEQSDQKKRFKINCILDFCAKLCWTTYIRFLKGGLTLASSQQRQYIRKDWTLQLKPLNGSKPKNTWN